MNTKNKPNKEIKSIPREIQSNLTTKSFNTSWFLMKTVVIFFGIISIAAIIIVSIIALSAMNDYKQLAYVITDKGTIIAEAVANEDKKAKAIEVENHVRLFFSKMYSFNEFTFQQNVEDGLYLIGAEGNIILEKFIEQKTPEVLRTTGMNVYCTVDSMWVNTENHPYKVRAFVRRTFETSSGKLIRRLFSDLTIRDLKTRHPKNIHGLLIDHIEIFDQSILENTQGEEFN